MSLRHLVRPAHLKRRSSPLSNRPHPRHPRHLRPLCQLALPAAERNRRTRIRNVSLAACAPTVSASTDPSKGDSALVLSSAWVYEGFLQKVPRREESDRKIMNNPSSFTWNTQILSELRPFLLMFLLVLSVRVLSPSAVLSPHEEDSTLTPLQHRQGSCLDVQAMIRV